MTRRDEIRNLVIDALRECKPKARNITGETRVIEDLRLISDDATEVIFNLEKKTGANPPAKEWLDVSTVDEMVELLLKHAPNQITK